MEGGRKGGRKERRVGGKKRGREGAHLKIILISIPYIHITQQSMYVDSRNSADLVF